MGMTLQEQCNAILDDKSLFEEDQVDMLEELVVKRFGSKISSGKIEKVILDIMWKHKDPTKVSEPKLEIVGFEDIKTKVDIPSLERRLELQRELLALEASNEAQRKLELQTKTKQEKFRVNQEYEEIIKRKAELYGEKKTGITESTNISPIDQIYSMFDKSVQRITVEQALKTTGYNLVEAATMIVNKLKTDSVEAQERTPPAEESEEKCSFTPPRPARINMTSLQFKVPCSFLIKSGSCLRSDCPYNHDLKSITCSYWLKGNCFNNEACQFKHALVEIKSFGTSPAASSCSQASNGGKLLSKFNAGNAATFIPSFNPSRATPFISLSSPASTERPKILTTKPLRKPKYTPWENADHSVHFKTYMTHKVASFKHEGQRRKFAQASTEAWKPNNSHQAKKLSEKANKFETKYMNELKLADEALGLYSESCSEEVWYEMYGLEFDDATEEIEADINEMRQKHKRGSTTIYLVVPRIVDAYGCKRTTRPIILWLESKLCSFVLLPQGKASTVGDVIGIGPWSI